MMRTMKARRSSYTIYGIGCAIVWLVILAIANTTAGRDKRRTINVVCGGWWIGWLSASIARHVYRSPSAGVEPS